MKAGIEVPASTIHLILLASSGKFLSGRNFPVCLRWGDRVVCFSWLLSTRASRVVVRADAIQFCSGAKSPGRPFVYMLPETICTYSALWDDGYCIDISGLSCILDWLSRFTASVWYDRLKKTWQSAWLFVRLCVDQMAFLEAWWQVATFTSRNAFNTWH